MTEATRTNGDAAAHAGRRPSTDQRPLAALSDPAGPPLVRYRVVERIARSSQDARYLVHRLDGGTLAELRVLSGDLGASAGLVRAVSEHAARVASAARDCPGIASVHECERVSRGALLVTVERPPGPTLREVLQEDARLAVPRAVRLAIQIAEALEQAHGLGLVHGGLRPDNVVLSGADETVSLTHFGLDRLLGSPARGLRRPLGVDDRVYQAPEQTSGNTTARSDVYALGVLLYEMLAGVPPPLPSRLRAAPKSLREQRPDVAPSLDRLVMQALHPAPRRRPASISAMCTDLWTEVSPYGRPSLPDQRPSWPEAFLRRLVLLAGAILAAGALTASTGMLIVWLGLMGEPQGQPRAPSRDPVGRTIERPPDPRTIRSRGEADSPAPTVPTEPARDDGEPGTSERGRAPRDASDSGAPTRRVPAPRPAPPDRAASSADVPGGAARRPATSAPREPDPAPRVRPGAVSNAEDADIARRGRATEPPGASSRAESEDPGAIIDWLIGEGARQRR